MSSPGRPFRVLGLQQVALGALDRTLLEHLWVHLLGLPVVGAYRSVKENVDERVLQLGSGPGAVEVDLMQPVDPSARPCVHTPPLHHVGLWIDDLPAAVAWLTAQGVRFASGGIRPGASGHNVCFVHPKGDGAFPVGGAGVLLELVQAPPELCAAVDDAVAPFPAP